MGEYPKHCVDCWKLKECTQKYFMNANTEPINGYADFDAADHYCGDCLNETHHYAPIDNAEVDSPAHCSCCGVPLNCVLTADGVEYVKEAIRDGNGCCRELWPVLFAEYLED